MNRNTSLVLLLAAFAAGCGGGAEPGTELSFLGDGHAPTSVVAPPLSSSIVATLHCTGPTSDAQREWTGESGWVVPAAVAVASGNAGQGITRLSYGSAKGADDVVTCTYRGGAATAHPTLPDDVAQGRVYVLESCTDGRVAGAVVSDTWAMLNVESADCVEPSSTVSVVARLLPPPTAGDSPLLRLTPSSVVLTDPSETRTLTVRAFSGTREVSTTGLGLTLEVMGDGVSAQLLAGGTLAIRAARFPGWAALGVRSSTDSGASTGTVVMAAPLSSDVTEVRASQLAMPTVGIEPIDPMIGEWTSDRMVGVGPFTFDDITAARLAAPGELADGESLDVAVVRASLAPALAAGTRFASTDGAMFAGRVSSVEVSGAYALVRFVPISAVGTLADADVAYDGQLSAAGYTVDSANEQLLDARFEEQLSSTASSTEGATAHALRVPVGPFQCEVTGDSSLASVTLPVPTVTVTPRDYAFAMRRTAEGLALDARAYLRVNIAVVAELRAALSGAVTLDCEVPDESNLYKVIPTGLGPLVIELELASGIEIKLSGTGGPTGVIRWSGNTGLDLDIGIRATSSGVVPHPAVQDLDGDGVRNVAEFAVLPAAGSWAPLVAFDPGGLTGDAPVFVGEFEVNPSGTVVAGLAIGSERLVRRIAKTTGRLRGLIMRLPPVARGRLLDALEGFVWTAELLRVLRLAHVQAEFALSGGVRYESSGQLLTTAYDNTDYHCHEVQRLGASGGVTVSAGVLQGLSELLATFLTNADSHDAEPPLQVAGSLQFPLGSFYTCLNPGDVSGYVRRDSRRCGMPLGSGESATLHLSASSPTTVVNTSILGGPSVDSAEVFLDTDGGAIAGSWRSLGTLPVSGITPPPDGSSVTNYEYDGAISLDSATAQRLDGEGAGTLDNSVRILSWSRMGALDTPNQLGELRPPCGCVTDADCDGDRCVRVSSATVGVCQSSDELNPEFIANHLRFRSPSTGQAVTGDTCGGTEVTGVNLGVTFSFGHVVGTASLHLDGEQVSSTYLGYQPDNETLLSDARSLRPGRHTLMLRVEYEDSEGIQTAQSEASFVARIRPCCPDGQRFNQVTEVCEDDDLPCPPGTVPVNRPLPPDPITGMVRFSRSCEAVPEDCEPCEAGCWGQFLYVCAYWSPTDRCPGRDLVCSGCC